MEVGSHLHNACCSSCSGSSPDKTRQTLDQFKRDLILLLGDNLFDIIIHGSYALDDFQPGKGDLDYMVVTNENLDDAINTRLFELHDKYRIEKHLLLHQLEGAFYPKHLLRELSLPFTGCYIGTTRKGWRTIHTFRNSFIDLKLIKEHGIHLLGRDVEFYSPSEAEIIREFAESINSFILCSKTDQNRETEMWISCIHLCARIVFYLSEGRMASKTEACRWCISSTELKRFSAVFKFAENLRYPYENVLIAYDLQVSCILLLQYIQDVLTLLSDI